MDHHTTYLQVHSLVLQYSYEESAEENHENPVRIAGAIDTTRIS
jgi:hypothetical protein